MGLEMETRFPAPASCRNVSHMTDDCSHYHPTFFGFDVYATGEDIFGTDTEGSDPLTFVAVIS